MHQLVQLLVPARAATVQERVQRLLLAVLGQAAQPARARPGVHAARLALFERARQAAAAAGLLHQLAAHRHRGAHGPGLLVARLTRHERRAAAAEAEQWQQQGNAQQHLGLSGKNPAGTVINWISVPIFPLRPVRVRTSGVGVRVRSPSSTGARSARQRHRTRRSFSRSLCSLCSSNSAMGRGGRNIRAARLSPFSDAPDARRLLHWPPSAGSFSGTLCEQNVSSVALSLPFKKKKLPEAKPVTMGMSNNVGGGGALVNSAMLLSQGGCWHASRSARYRAMLLEDLPLQRGHALTPHGESTKIVTDLPVKSRWEA